MSGEQEEAVETGAVEASFNPTFEEVVGMLRQQLGQAQFEAQLLSITNEKLRQRIAELESELGIDDEEG